jgi:endoglucanase
MRAFSAVFLLAGFISAPAFAADKLASDKPRVLVDFRSPDAFQLEADKAKARVEERADKSRELEILTDADAAYPSVYISPKEGKWDLTGFASVEAEIINPQDQSVRVLLSINNPGADGRNHCNVESAEIAAHGEGTVVVPFGMWHGSSGHNLDLTKIVSLQVLLDRPGKSHRFFVTSIRAVPAGYSRLGDIANDPFFKQLRPAYGRGINLGNALEAPNEGEWGVTLKAEYFEKIHAAGFDSVRIPVRWSAHAGESAPYRIDANFFARVDWAVHQALDNHLIPILNMHHYDGLMDDPQNHRERFVALWTQIAEHYSDYPPSLVLELLNEPHNKLTADIWNSIAAAALATIRKSNPTREIVIGPVMWNSINELGGLQLPESDRHITVTVHYYSPFQFTHQGADFIGPDAQKWLGTKWTGSDSEQQAVGRDFDTAILWAVKHRRPIYLGEFGSFNKAEMDSRVRWTAFIASEALRRKMSFAYWEFCSSFGCYDPQKDEWIASLKNALLTPAPTAGQK